MDQQLRKRSDIDRMVATGEAVKEPPRQQIRDARTGKIISNPRVPEMLPTFLIEVQSNFVIYNDVDVKAFQEEMRAKLASMVEAIQDEQFQDAGLMYEQFIDQYESCSENPSNSRLETVIVRGIDLYSVLDRQGDKLASKLRMKDLPYSKEIPRFIAVTEAHINLFLSMLTLNLSLYNKIDGPEKLLHRKLSLLERRLNTLLTRFIYADESDHEDNGKPVSSSLYGWLLLHKNDHDAAQAIYLAEAGPKKHDRFSDLYSAVMLVYKQQKNETVEDIHRWEFGRAGMSNSRLDFALKLRYFLQQTAQIRAYLDELTQGSENPGTDEAFVDVRSLLVPPTVQIAAQ